ncbi:MAG: hypothetical protein K9F97_00035 [Candidatus Nanopelagicales bacterium]|nr:hypothetical protein [Candidatus Nanopelagicales bacterium]
MAIIESRRLADKVLDVTVFILATASLTYYSSRYFTTSALVVAGVWVVVALLLFILIRRFTEVGFYGEPVPAPYLTSDPSAHRNNVLARNVTWTGLLVAVLAYLYIENRLPNLSPSQWALTILVLVAIGSVLAFRLAKSQVEVAADYKTFHWFAWLIAAGMSLVASATLRPQSDDTNYVNISTWIAERGTISIRDTVYSDQVFDTKPLGSSWESMWGVFAHITNMSAPTLLYVIAVPILTAISIFALDRGMRSMHVRHTNFALIVVSLFLILDGENIFSFGVFHGPRIWQGKSFFVSAMIPLLIGAGIVWARSGRRNDLIRFLLIAIGATGLTTTATMLVPMFTLVVAGVVGYQRGIKDAGWTSLAMLAPLYVGLAFRGTRTADSNAMGHLAPDTLAFAQPANILSGLDELPDPNEFVRLMAEPPFHAALFALVMCWGWLGSESRTARRVIAGVTLLWAIVYLPPVLAVIEEITGVAQISWRFWWLMPIPMLLGAAASACASGLIRITNINRHKNLTLGLATALLLALIVIPGKPVWFSSLGQVNLQSARLMWPPGWKVFGGYYEAMEILDVIAKDGDIVAARQNIEFSMAATTVRIHPVLPKVYWFPEVTGPLGEPQYLDRVTIRQFTSKDQDVLLPPLDLSALPGALQRVGVDVICLDADRPDAIRLVKSFGYTQGARVVKYSSGRGQWCARLAN